MSAPVPRLGNTPTRLRMEATPIASVVLASATPSLLPVIAQVPTLPPLGLLFLVGWRLVHHELWPLWIGVPLGLFDDLTSGNPLGTAMLLWSVVMMAIEIVDARLMWRDYWHDWLIATGAAAFFLAGGVMIGWVSESRASLLLILPQLLWSTLLYPLIVRAIAVIDRWRMMA